MKVLGYIYEADVHCVSCSIERFPEGDLKREEVLDFEGNPVTPLFEIDDYQFLPEGVNCGDCGYEIIPSEVAEDEESGEYEDYQDEGFFGSAE